MSSAAQNVPRTVRIALLAVALLCGCSGDDEAPEPQRTGDGGGGPKGWLAAVGGDGTLAATFDDRTWSVRRVAEADLHAVACVGNEHGWLAGSGGLVLHTTDGGTTFTAQPTSLAARLEAIAFAMDPFERRLVGVTAGEAGALAVSVNGGESWRAVTNATDARLRDASMASEVRLALVVGDAGLVLRSSDGLESFSTTRIAGASDLEAVSLDASGRVAIAVDTEGGIFASSDGGLSFVREHSAGVPLRGVALSHAGSWALAVGDSGRALVREPIGRWGEVSTGTSAALHAALVTHDEERLYAAGAAGTLLRSADLGQSWSRVPLDTTVTLEALEDLDPH